MTVISAEKVIAQSLFDKTVSNLEIMFSDKTALLNSVKYAPHDLNESLKNSFGQIVYVLQNVVDAFYFNYYEVPAFMPFTKGNFEDALAHNLSLIGSIKKLLRFVA